MVINQMKEYPTIKRTEIDDRIRTKNFVMEIEAKRNRKFPNIEWMDKTIKFEMVLYMQMSVTSAAGDKQ